MITGWRDCCVVEVRVGSTCLTLVGGGCGGVYGKGGGRRFVVTRCADFSTVKSGGDFCAHWKWRSAVGFLDSMTGARGGSWSSDCCPRRTTVHTALGILCSLGRGAVDTSGSQHPSAQLSKTSGTTLLVSIVGGDSWCLGGSGPYGSAICDDVCLLVAMAKMGQLGAKNLVLGLRGGR